MSRPVVRAHLKASAKKDPEVKKKAVEAFGGFGQDARDYLIANLGKADGG